MGKEVVAALVFAAGVGIGIVLSRSVLKPKIGKKTVKHVLIANFKKELSQEAVDKLVEGYKGLTLAIPAMKGFEWGTNVSQENLDKGFTHCFISTFDSEEGVKEYLVHPAHIKYAEELLPNLVDAVILDFVPEVTKSRFYSA